nr:transposase (putative), gypsy type [Tanacetum cinerariifolium]
MVLQLTDITSEITDEELLEFTSEYYISLALHPVVPTANASIAEFPVGKVGRGENNKIRESLPRDERPTPVSYSMEDVELINENRIPINAYSEAFLCHMGISSNYLHSPEEVPTFISDDGREMGLFNVVHLSKPKLVTKGVRPLRDGEEPLLEATAGRTMELVLEQPEDENTAVLEPTPLQAVGITRAKSEIEEVNSRLKRKRATSGDGAGSSKRVRHVILGDSASTEGEAMDALPATAAKDITETPPPNVEAASNTSAPVTHVEQSPPMTSSFTTDNLSQGGRETGPKVFEGMPADQLMEEIDMVAAHQAALVAQLKARFFGECSRSVQKDEEIALLKAQLADARVEAESARSYAYKLAEEKMSLLVQLDQKRSSSADHKASCHWVVKYLEGAKNNHFAGLEEFRQGVEERLEKQEGKLRKLSIEYDEELYPHLVSSIAERRWLISHGLRLTAMCTLESQEVKQSFGDVVKCALARGRAEAVEELHENKLLTVPAAQVPGYNKDAYEELVAAMEKMKLLELPHIAQLERDQDYPIDVIMAGLTLARHDTEGAEAQSDFFLKPDEIPLKESLEAHSMRLAKKKGVKGKAILCGVGAAHLPRSDGVPISVATVSPRDSDLLEKLKEARNVAYQVDSSERGRSHSV